MSKPLCENLELIEPLNLKGWLEDQARNYQLKYILAHVEDGVIWGYFHSNGDLVTPTEPKELFTKYKFPSLRTKTLHQCRAFGVNSEVMIWQSNGVFKARLINDENIIDKEEECIIENQILWGTHRDKQELDNKDFTLVVDGQPGLIHAVPLNNIPFKDDERPLRLTVHHYIDHDDSGVARIYLSRLVKLYF